MRTLVLVLRSFLKSLCSLTLSMRGETFTACRTDAAHTCVRGWRKEGRGECVAFVIIIIIINTI